MLASSFLDPVVGVDIHWELVPMPAPTPTPLPNPFTGIVFDPVGLAAGLVIGAAISAVLGAPIQGPVFYWTAVPATNTGTEAKHVPGHIMLPPGTGWAPVPKTPKPVIRPGETPDPPKPISPDNDAIAIFGSKTVTVMGSNAVRLGDIFLSCGEPVRLPSSVVIAVPKGAPILIGGPPSLDILAAVLASLRTRFMSDSLHAAVSRLRPGRLRNFLHRAVCFFTGHPVDVASGKVLTEHVDAALPGPLPLQIDRIYSSAWGHRDGRVGHGWSLSVDQAVWRERGRVVLRAEDGREIEFDTFDFANHRIEPGQTLYNPIERLTLRCLAGDAWEVAAADGVVRRFEPVSGDSAGGPLGPVARIKGARDRSGIHRHTYAYDDRGNLEAVTDALGRTVRFQHDAQGRFIALHLPKAAGEGWDRHRQYHYDQAGDLVAVTDASGAQWRYEYCTHLLVRDTDRTGYSYYFQYDGMGSDAWCTRTWGDDGAFDHTLAYDKAKHVTAVTDSLGNLTTYKMNVLGMVTSITDSLGGVTELEYDPRTLKRTKKVAPDGTTTTLEYDDRGNLTKLTRPDDAAFEFAYDGHDDLVQVTDALGGEWRWQYDRHGNTTYASNPLGEVTQVAWEKGFPAWVRRSNGNTVQFVHDGRGQLRAVKDDGGLERRLEWDRRGRQTRIHEVGGAKVSMHYDNEGRLIQLSRPSGEKQRRRYDAEGNLVAVADRYRTVVLERGAAGRVVARKEGDLVRKFEYDTEGRLLTHEDPGGARLTFERDELGRVIVEHKPDGGVQRFEYDAIGRVVAVTSPAERLSSLRYNAAGRLERVEHSDGAFTELEWRADGALLRASNECADILFDVDPLGRVLRESCGEQWVESSYGPRGFRKGIRSSLGLTQGYEADSRGQVAGMMLGDARMQIERNPAGFEVSRRAPGDVTVQWERDDRGRVHRRQTLTRAVDDPQRTTLVDDRRWFWEGDDRLVAQQDARTEAVIRYDYDQRGQLIRERRVGQTIARAYDAQGNVYRREDGRDCEYRYDGRLVRTSTATYEHDADGQRVARVDPNGETWSFAYDDRGMLRAIDRPDGKRIEYQYDALGRRIRKVRVRVEEESEPTVEQDTRYVWDRRRLLHEHADGEEVVSWYWSPHDRGPIAKRKGERLWSIVADATGNPSEMYDEAGRRTWQAQLDVYGRADVREGEPEDCPWRFAGQYEDTDARLHHNGFRYYDPATGSYLTRDPLGLSGSTNAYGYPANPWMYCDPFGLSPMSWEDYESGYNNWNAGEGAATPMDDATFKGRTWGLYQQMLHSSDTPIIGDFGDVDTFLKNNGPDGFSRLALPMPPATGFHWNTFVNDMWMQGFIDQRATVLLVTEPTEEALSSAEFGRSVFGREMDQLRAAGYRLLGVLGDEKDPLRMEPPCK